MKNYWFFDLDGTLADTDTDIREAWKATLSDLGLNHPRFDEIFVVTPDKDAAQLVRPGVKLYRPARAGDAAEIYDEQKVCEHWQLSSPLQMIDYLALAGDASDNIPGIRGVGEKTALSLMGWETGTFRLPLCEMSESNRAKLRAIMERAGLPV